MFNRQRLHVGDVVVINNQASPYKRQNKYVGEKGIVSEVIWVNSSVNTYIVMFSGVDTCDFMRSELNEA
jgi:hypothetical protein